MTESASEQTLPAEALAPFDTPWAAGQAVDSLGSAPENVVMLHTDSLKVGEAAFVIARCPTPEFAQYIAYFHNMLLQGSRMLGGDIESILQGIANRNNSQPPEQPPVETGGYL